MARDLTLVRPNLSEDVVTEMTTYLMDRARAAFNSRKTQVDSQYQSWLRNYDATPLEKIRVTPWYRASNLVVPLSRIYVDTFVSRTLNMVFATRPLYVLDNLALDPKGDLSAYLNFKAMGSWNHYNLAWNMVYRGAKCGTCIVKTTWDYVTDMFVKSEGEEQQVVVSCGPKSRAIPFEDFWVYPITAQEIDNVEVFFHQIRYTPEEMMRKVERAVWNISKEEVESNLFTNNDPTYQTKQELSGVTDSELKTFDVVECKFRYKIGSSDYTVIAVLHVGLSRILDLYFYPFHPKIPLYVKYTPYPREDFFYGDSIPRILGMLQEEASTIHNDRRNSSYLASSPQFKRKANSAVPNPSTTWYPGKVWDLESLDDFDVLNVGRALTGDLIAEEMQVFNLVERLLGLGPVMQGGSTGSLDKRGVYNTYGTLATMQEGNQRQDTLIKDFRTVLGLVGRLSLALQIQVDPADQDVYTLPIELSNSIRKILGTISVQEFLNHVVEVKVSDAGANSEIAKKGLFDLSQVLERLGSIILQMATQLADPNLNPQIRETMVKLVTLHRNLSIRLLRAYGENNLEQDLPDVQRINQPQPPPGQGLPGQDLSQGGNGSMAIGGAPGNPGFDEQSAIQALLQIPGVTQETPQ